MSTITEILARARSRDAALPYAGAVTPAEAHALLNADSAVKLIDVRTNAERDWVGRVAIPEAQHGAVQWSTYPGGVPNPQFLEQLAAVAAKDQVLLFLCRSGVRSRHAAKLATENGSIIPVGGKTGTGDQRFEVYGAGGRLIESRFVNRSATFVFNIGERFFGSMTAYVHGPESKNYDFTSALPVQLLVVLAPSLMPLIEPNAAPKAGVVAAVHNPDAAGSAKPTLAPAAAGATPQLRACGG